MDKAPSCRLVESELKTGKVVYKALEGTYILGTYMLFGPYSVHYFVLFD